MAGVLELTAGVGDLISPRPGPGVCVECFNFTRGFERCYACSAGEQHLDVVVPISYSVGQADLHRLLAGYKRCCGFGAERMSRRLAAMLWRFLALHERCVAARVGVRGFDVVTTVPSSDADRDETHPLRHVVGDLCAPTRERHRRLLLRTDVPVVARRFSAERYECRAPVDGLSVLLIDDMWTTGASAQSAAAALRAAGATSVAAVVLGRHLNPGWSDNNARVAAAARPFDWSCCALCAAAASGREAAAA